MDITTLFHRFLSSFNALFVIALFKVGGRKVIEICDVLIKFPCFFVVGDCLVEVPGFVCYVSFILFFVRSSFFG